MAETKIEWTDATWNPVTGCTKVSPGCKNCYAEKMHSRLTAMGQAKYAEPFGTVRCHEDALDVPLRWRKPRRIFVNSMSDLFHEEVSFKFIVQVYRVMQMAHWHTYQILTKRAERLLEFTRWLGGVDDISAAEWPRQCWLGVSAENQEQADKRIPYLLRTPAAVRFVSLEPLLGPVDIDKRLINCDGCGNQGSTAYITRYDDQLCRACDKGAEGPSLDWVICGGESGPHARPMHPDWVRSIRDQCQGARVPFFFKQWGEWRPQSHGARDGGKFPWGSLHVNGKFFPGATPWNGHDDDGIGGEAVMVRVGKKAAGRLLDGQEWNDFPGAYTATRESRSSAD